MKKYPWAHVWQRLGLPLTHEVQGNEQAWQTEPLKKYPAKQLRQTDALAAEQEAQKLSSSQGKQYFYADK